MNSPNKPTAIGTSYSVVFSHDGSLLATLGRYVWVWDVARGAKLLRAHPLSHPSNADFSPTGKALAVKNTAGRIAIISTASGKTIADFRNDYDGEGCNLLYSPCGEYLVDGSWKGRLSVRRATTGAREFVQDFPNEMIQGLYHCPANGRWVIAHGPKAKRDDQPPPPDYFSIWEWPFRKGKYDLLRKKIPFSWSVALSPDGNLIAVIHGAPPSMLSVFRLSDSTRVSRTTVQPGGTGNALGWSFNGRYIAAVQDETIVFYEFPSLISANELTLEYPSDVVFSPRLDFLALGSWKTGWLLPIDLLATPDISLKRNTRRQSAV